MHIITEYRKGVLFIRLMGRTDDINDLIYISNLIDKIGSRYIVLNINSLSNISLDSIKYINDYNKEILKKKQYLIICDSDIRRNRIFKEVFFKVANEVEVFSLI